MSTLILKLFGVLYLCCQKFFVTHMKMAISNDTASVQNEPRQNRTCSNAGMPLYAGY